MRRKTDMDIIKENYWLIILSALLILFGVFCAILPHIAPHVSYDSLQTKEVTVTVFKRFYGGPYGASYDYIRTTDGEKYNLSGDYQRGQLQELLTEGKTVTIKWYKNKPFWTLLAEEMYVDGKRVVIVDDTFPSLQTANHLVSLLKKAGAKEIHYRVASPMIKSLCNFGIDIPAGKQEISENYSVVTTILSPEITVGAMTAENDVVGIIENNAYYSADGFCHMSYIVKNSHIDIGEAVLTSGGSVFPADMMVGTIKEIYSDSNGLTLHAVIEPAEDILSVTDVFVVTSFDGQGKS